MNYKDEFIRIYTENITRAGSVQLLEWLNTTDFFTAPASTRFHGACEGGLVMHSVNVYNVLSTRFFDENENAESFAITALLHDLCKANFYKAGFRNVKNEVSGQWEKVPTYNVQDAFPYGHGEKSVY
ncbi:MAG: hydrolase, partial [Oscillospiraceae bacterium]